MAHLSVLRVYLWRCAKCLLLVELRGLYGKPGIESRLAVCNLPYCTISQYIPFTLSLNVYNKRSGCGWSSSTTGKAFAFSTASPSLIANIPYGP